MVALVLLIAVDIPVRAWHPTRDRLSPTFSATALDVAASDASSLDHPVVALGDSVVWGYGLPPQDSVVAQLRSQHRPLSNLSFEGGSPANTYFLLRLLIEHGVKPAAVIFNVNSKVFNPNDSAYRRLHPSFERLVEHDFRPQDLRRLDVQAARNVSARIGAFLESVWRL